MIDRRSPYPSGARSTMPSSRTTPARVPAPASYRASFILSLPGLPNLPTLTYRALGMSISTPMQPTRLVRPDLRVGRGDPEQVGNLPTGLSGANRYPSLSLSDRTSDA